VVWHGGDHEDGCGVGLGVGCVHADHGHGVDGEGDEELQVECSVDEPQKVGLAGLHRKRRRVCPKSFSFFFYFDPSKAEQPGTVFCYLWRSTCRGRRAGRWASETLGAAPVRVAARTTSMGFMSHHSPVFAWQHRLNTLIFCHYCIFTFKHVCSFSS
jgi:hypothetical protein